MITLRIVDTNNNNYFPQKVENLNFKKIHYGGNSELSFKLNENPLFQNHKVGLFNNIYLYNFSQLIWQGYITEFQRDYKNLNYNARASGLLIDFRNKRIKKTYVLDDIGEFKNWSEYKGKKSSEILYGYRQEKDDKGIRIDLLQRNYITYEHAIFEIKIDENIERLKARVFINQPVNFTTKLVTLDENRSNPYLEKFWTDAQLIDEDVILDISSASINKRYLQFRLECKGFTAITVDRYFSQLENLKLLTSDDEINAANILKDLLLNHTQKLDLDPTLIQDCFNYKDIELCESLDDWIIDDDKLLTLSLENTIIKKGSHSIKTIVEKGAGNGEVYECDFSYDDGNWTFSNSSIIGGVLDITAQWGFGQRSPNNSWYFKGTDVFVMKVKFKQDSNAGVTGADVLIYLVGDGIPIVFDTKNNANLMRIHYNGLIKDSQAFIDDTNWHEIQIRKIGTTFYFSIDGGGEISWNYGTERALNYFRLRMGNCTGHYDDFKFMYKDRVYLQKTLSVIQDLQNKNLFRFWVNSTITGNILKARFGENERMQYEPDWTCQYEADQEPPAADPVWALIGVDYGSVSEGIFRIDKVAANQCAYKRADVGHNITGNTILTRVKVSNATKTTYLQITDGIANVTIAIKTSGVQDWYDATNSYTVNMQVFRELWLTMKDNIFLLYVDGILALKGETQETVDTGFVFAMDDSVALGTTWWDYVYYFKKSFLRNKRIEKTITIDVADAWEEKIIDLNNFSIETRNEMKYIQFEILTNNAFTFYIDWIRSNFELTSAYYRDRTAPLNILEDVLAYQDYEWTILKSGRVKFFEVDRDVIDYICPIKNLTFEENSTSYFSKIFLVYFDEMMKRQEIELIDEDSKIPFDKEHVIGLGGISDTGAKTIGEAQFEFHKKPRYQLDCLVDNFVFDKNGGRINPIEIESNNNIKFLGISRLPIFRIIATDYANNVCRLTLETYPESTPNIMKSIIGVL